MQVRMKGKMNKKLCVPWGKNFLGPTMSMSTTRCQAESKIKVNFYVSLCTQHFALLNTHHIFHTVTLCPPKGTHARNHWEEHFFNRNKTKTPQIHPKIQPQRDLFVEPKGPTATIAELLVVVCSSDDSWTDSSLKVQT